MRKFHGSPKRTGGENEVESNLQKYLKPLKSVLLQHKLAPVQRRRGKTKERGRQLQIGGCCSAAKLYLTLWPHGLQLTRPVYSSLSLGVSSDSCPLSQWCHPTISSSVAPFSIYFQSVPASGSFPVSWFFTSGGQSMGASASASVLPMSIQAWFHLGLTGRISLQFKGLSRVFSSTTILKHRFFGAQPSYGPALTSIHDYWKNYRNYWEKP